MRQNPRRHKLVSEINITPFTDVILVLLVIFMITTPLMTESSLKVRLPETKNAKPAEKAKHEQAQITVSAEGPIYLDEKLVTKKELMEKIRSQHEANPDLSVVLRSDRLVRFKDIVDILDPLTELGITKLSIATVNE